MSVLDELVAGARTRVERMRAQRPLAEIEGRAPSRKAGRLAAALRGPETAVIAEFKRRSPSAGEIRPGAGVEEMVAAYERGGASALSVLTEEERFGGSLADLEEARSVTGLPLLRKDFTIDPYQLAEAAAAGADAVLLIVAALADAELELLLGEARDRGLDALVEVHDAAELERALAAGASLVGINNRDLRTFEVSLDVTRGLAPRARGEVTLVAESGIGSRAEVAEMSALGVDAVLVGEALMRAPDPAAALADLRGAALGFSEG